MNLEETKEKIQELFSSLGKVEQIEMLKVLSTGTTTSLSIADFAEKHQKEYGENITFAIDKKGADHCPTIIATVETAYGDFAGEGSNQKIAKAKAIEEANKNWPR